MGLFSSSSRSRKNWVTKNIDAPVGVEGDNALVLGQDAAFAGSGAFTTRVGDMSSMTQEIAGDVAVGMSGADVSEMLRSQAEQNTASLGTISNLADTAIGQLATASSGDTADWTRYLPYIVLGVVAIAMVRSK